MIKKATIIFLCIVFFAGLIWSNYYLSVRLNVVENNQNVIDLYLNDVERDMKFFDEFMIRMAERINDMEAAMYQSRFGRDAVLEQRH